MTLKLRPHHIGIALEYLGINKRLVRLGVHVLHRDDISTKNYLNFLDGITINTEVEVVEQDDDLCNRCNCPYLTGCNSGDYTRILENVASRIPPWTPPQVMDLIRSLTPDKVDDVVREKYGLIDGQTYRFGDIKKPDVIKELIKKII